MALYIAAYKSSGNTCDKPYSYYKNVLHVKFLILSRRCTRWLVTKTAFETSTFWRLMN